MSNWPEHPPPAYALSAAEFDGKVNRALELSRSEAPRSDKYQKESEEEWEEWDEEAFLAAANVAAQGQASSSSSPSASSTFSPSMRRDSRPLPTPGATSSYPPEKRASLPNPWDSQNVRSSRLSGPRESANYTTSPPDLGIAGPSTIADAEDRSMPPPPFTASGGNILSWDGTSPHTEPSAATTSSSAQFDSAGEAVSPNAQQSPAIAPVDAISPQNRILRDGGENNAQTPLTPPLSPLESDIFIHGAHLPPNPQPPIPEPVVKVSNPVNEVPHIGFDPSIAYGRARPARFRPTATTVISPYTSFYNSAVIAHIQPQTSQFNQVPPPRHQPLHPMQHGPVFGAAPPLPPQGKPQNVQSLYHPQNQAYPTDPKYGQYDPGRANVQYNHNPMYGQR